MPPSHARSSSAPPGAVAAAAVPAGLMLGVITLSHLVTDAYTALLTPLLPALRASFGVTIAQTAVLVAVSSFVGSMLQPAFGMLADRSDRRIVAALGPLVCAAGMALLGVAPGFAAVAVLVTLGGVGSGLFHPAAIAYVHQGSHARRRGLFAALFAAGGTAGQAVGPLAATALGLARLHWLLPVGLATAALSWATTPSARAAAGAPRRWRDYAAVFRGPIRTLWAASVLRSLGTISYISLLGFVLTAQGQARHIGPALATFSLGSAAGGILGGLLSDRLGRIAVLRSSVLAGIPLFVALVYGAPGQWWYYPLTALVGVVVNANTPVAIVLAQEYAPDHVATASALMMGFAWGTSGVLFTLVGALADLTSPRTAMVAAILLLVPALWLTVRLPEPTPAPH
jgi:FSR family fosmidomycin resistance protein-like MFS transporter